MVKDLCFEIIQTCPNNCRFCSSCAGMDKDTMISYDTFVRAINHFMNIGGIEEISFSGGEPFLHPNLFEMIKYCKDLGIRVVLFTSGVRRNRQLTNEQMDELRDCIIARYNSFKDLPEAKKKALIDKELNIYTQYNSRQFSSISRQEMEYLKSIGYKYSMTTVHPDNIYCARNIMKNGLEKVSQKTFKRGIRNIYFKEL